KPNHFRHILHTDDHGYLSSLRRDIDHISSAGLELLRCRLPTPATLMIAVTYPAFASTLTTFH
ncbi:MAG TPA: hypothetical protein VES69_01405, partial [Pyrinomonadaceae bacterium]|nr:hypothetical protein [Pyrinomonadaceae bacterium]